MYTASDIADLFLASVDREAGEVITHLKLQKLIYYAQAWSLALRDQALFEEDFQAWAHGPVVRSVYDRFSGSSWAALPPPDCDITEIDSETADLLEDILDSYGLKSPKQLESLTHKESPWLDARGHLPPEARSENIISKESMNTFYKDLYSKTDGEEQ